MKQKYCLNCKQYVTPERNYRNIYGKQNLGTFLLGKLKPERCPICRSSNFAEVAPETDVVQTKETVIKEVVLIPCAYCKSLMPQTPVFCPHCGARRKG